MLPPHRFTAIVRTLLPLATSTMVSAPTASDRSQPTEKVALAVLTPAVQEPLHVVEQLLQPGGVLAELPPVPDHLQLPGDPQLAGDDPRLDPVQAFLRVHPAVPARWHALTTGRVSPGAGRPTGRSAAAPTTAQPEPDVRYRSHFMKAGITR